MTDANSEDVEPDLQSVLDALDDPDCRTLLRELTRPMTAQELMDACELTQTTTYRKLDRLSDAGLVDGDTEVRQDGHHTTRYKRAFAGVAIWLTGEETFDVTMISTTESAETRLTRFWRAISDQL